MVWRASSPRLVWQIITFTCPNTIFDWLRRDSFTFVYHWFSFIHVLNYVVPQFVPQLMMETRGWRIDFSTANVKCCPNKQNLCKQKNADTTDEECCLFCGICGHSKVIGWPCFFVALVDSPKKHCVLCVTFPFVGFSSPAEDFTRVGKTFGGWYQEEKVGLQRGRFSLIEAVCGKRWKIARVRFGAVWLTTVVVVIKCTQNMAFPANV